MRRHLALILVIFLSLAAYRLPAHADLMVKNPANGAELRLFDTPCSHGGTLAVLKEEWRPKFKNAKILGPKGDLKFYGCWLQESEETIVVMLEDGSLMAFDSKIFSDPAI